MLEHLLIRKFSWCFYQRFALACFYQKLLLACLTRSSTLIRTSNTSFTQHNFDVSILFNAWVRISSEMKIIFIRVSYLLYKIYSTCYHQNSKIWLEPNYVLTLRSHEIELDEYEPQKKGKSIALKSTKKFDTNAFQAEEGSSDDSASEEDELSLLSKRINQMWKHRKKKFKNYKRSEDKAEPSGHRKSSEKDIVCYECKEPGHSRSECPKL